jgi:hypothetical protein
MDGVKNLSKNKRDFIKMGAKTGTGLLVKDGVNPVTNCVCLGLTPIFQESLLFYN